MDDVITVTQDYLTGNGASGPFFVAFDASADVETLVTRLSSCEKVLRVSDYCRTSDSLPDLDALGCDLISASGKAILLGIGEYAALFGDNEVIRWLWGLALHNFRLVVPVWNGYEFLEKEWKLDPRIRNRRGAAFAKTGKHWMIRVFKEGLVKKPAASGLKNLMKILEVGSDQTLTAITAVRPLNKTWCRLIDSAYAVYKERYPQSNVQEAMFTEKQWADFLDEDRIHDDSLDSADSLLRLLENGTGDNPYLSLAISKTQQYSEWQGNLHCAILEISSDANEFSALYESRKKISKDFDQTSIDEFIQKSRSISDPSQRLRYMTDNTPWERKEILRTIAAIGNVPETVKNVYPSLWDYWRQFTFRGDNFAETLTQYFQNYKRQKLLGKIEPDFMASVCDLATNRPQFVLPTRESVLENIGTNNTILCWVDALGCEFLGFIQSVAERSGLQLKVTPVRVKLPSITSENRAFYDVWPNEKKMCPISKLDKIKHGLDDSIPASYSDVKAEHEPQDTDNNPATELPDELQVVKETIYAISARLRREPGSKVVLTSDHGATRLAVISHNETVWELPEKGKYSGRCCRKSDFDGKDLPACSTESDDGNWHILAGYDRFKGGRKGYVEVHGGATLEEMVVPVIEFELLNKNIQVKLEKDEFRVTFRDTEITLLFSCNTTLKSPFVAFEGSRYEAAPDDSRPGWYSAKLTPPAAGGDFEASVYDGDTEIAKVSLTVIRGGAQIKKDDFF